MLPRVTTQTLSTRVVRSANQHLNQIAKLNEQLSTGLRVNRPSDDPTAIRSILTYRSRVTRADVHVGNIEDARLQLNHSVSELLSAKDVIVRARELAVEGRQTQSPELLSREVDHLFNRLVEIANQSVDGEHLFSGADSATAPFEIRSDAAGQTEVLYHGSKRRSAAAIGSSLTVETRFSGAEVFLRTARDATHLFGGATGAAPGPGADSGVGFGALQVAHTSTSYAGGGVLPGASSPGGDTILGPPGAHSLDIQNLGGGVRTVSLNGGPAVEFTAADTDLQVSGPKGETVYLDLSGVPGAFAGAVDATANGSLSVDGGATSTPIDFTATQRLTDSRTGAVTGIDSTNIRAVGTEHLEYPGTSNAFTALLQLRDDLANTRNLAPQEFQEALTRHIGELDRQRDNILRAVGDQSLELENLDGVQTRLEDLNLGTAIALGTLENADIAEVVTGITTAQNLLQSTYAASARLLNLSLLDYL